MRKIDIPRNVQGVWLLGRRAGVPEAASRGGGLSQAEVEASSCHRLKLASPQLGGVFLTHCHSTSLPRLTLGIRLCCRGHVEATHPASECARLVTPHNTVNITVLPHFAELVFAAREVRAEERLCDAGW